jgi:hypothetical protein
MEAKAACVRAVKLPLPQAGAAQWWPASSPFRTRHGGRDTSPVKYLQAALDVAWNSRVHRPGLTFTSTRASGR